MWPYFLLLALIELFEALVEAETTTGLFQAEYILRSTWEEHATNRVKALGYGSNEMTCAFAFLKHKKEHPASTLSLVYAPERYCELDNMPDSNYLLKPSPGSDIVQLYLNPGESLEFPEYMLLSHNGYLQLQNPYLSGLSSVIDLPTNGPPGMPTNADLVYNPWDMAFYHCTTAGIDGLGSKKCFKDVIGSDRVEIASMSYATVEAHLAIVEGKHVWVAGGSSDNSYTTTFDTSEIYNPETGIWSPGLSLPRKVAGGCMPSINHKRFYLIAGAGNGFTMSNLVHYYDYDNPQQGWVSMPSLPASIVGPACAIFKDSGGADTIGVMGGTTSGRCANPSAVDTFYTLRVTGSAWETKAKYYKPIMRAAAVTIQGKMVTLGGSLQPCSNQRGIYEYDPGENKWLWVNEMPFESGYPAVALFNS